jgi:hypothetical protein
MQKRRLDAFTQGQGLEVEAHVCADCGYTSTNRKNFRRSEDGDGHTCSTGHYEKDGELKRAINPYAKKR